MEQVTYRIHDHLTIAIHGRLNAQNADEIREKILLIRKRFPDGKLILDLSDLEYLSSSGIRVFLGLMKKEPEGIVLEEVSLEIFDILDMTGLTSVIPTERKKRILSIEGLKRIGSGGVGTVYQADEDTLIKTFHEGVDLSEARNELANAKKVFIEGIPTAIPFDIVRIKEGGFGVVYEMLNSKSALQKILENPQQARDLGKQYGRFMKEIHQNKMESGSFPDQKAFYLQLLKNLEGKLDPKQLQVFEQYLNSIPAEMTFSHGDLHPGNVLYQADEPMLIDLGTIGLGHPIFDLVSLYAFMLPKTLMESTDPGFRHPRSGLNAKEARDFFEGVLQGYFPGSSPKQLEILTREIDRFNPLRNALLYTHYFQEESLSEYVKAMFSTADQLIGPDAVLQTEIFIS